MGSDDARCASVLAGVARKALAPRPRISVSEWAQRHRVVTDGDTRGPWRNERTPYLVEPMDAMTDDAVRVVTIKKGSQTGGTAAQQNMLLAAIDMAPGTIMLVYPSGKSASEKNQLRLLPLFRACAPVARRLSPRAHDIKRSSIRFDVCDLLVRGTVNEHHLESDPCRYVFCDELDRCEPRTAHLVLQRTKTYANGKVVFVGKPGLAGQGIDEQYARSDRRVYMVPCPTCGFYHERVFAVVRWEGLTKEGVPSWDTRDLDAPPSVVKKTACAKCPACGERIGPELNHWQLSLGVWRPAGCEVGQLECLESDRSPVFTVARARARWKHTPGKLLGTVPESDHRGYHVPELVSGLVSNPYAGAAEDFVLAKGAPTPEWMADRLGLAWNPAGRKIDVASLRGRITPAQAGGFRLGKLPAGVRCLVAGVDVQRDRCYVTVRGFGPRGNERWTVWHECVPSFEGAGLGQAVDDVLYKRRWFREGGGELRIAARFLDSGDRTDEVYAYCRSRPQCYAVKGRGADVRGASPSWPHRWTRQDVKIDGRVLEKGVYLLLLNSGLWKGRVQSRLRLVSTGEQNNEAPPEASVGETGSGGLLPWHLPEDVSDDYLRQVTAEECVVKTVGTRRVYEWRLRDGHPDNHYFDAECYVEAGADALGIASRDFGEPGAKTPPADGQDRQETAAVARRVDRGMSALAAQRQENKRWHADRSGNS